MPCIEAWHDFVFTHKPVWSWNSASCCWADGLYARMWVGRLKRALYLFPPWVPCTVSFLVNCCQLYCWAVPCVWLCLITHPVCSEPYFVSGYSQCSISWKWGTGLCCCALCLSVPLRVFLGSPISGSLISSSKNNPVQQSHDPPAFTNLLGKRLFIKTLNTRIKCSSSDESGINFAF